MAEAKSNSGGISRKILIPIGAVVFLLSTWFSYSIFHHPPAAAGKATPAQTAQVTETWDNSGENAPAEAMPSGIGSEPVGTPGPSPSLNQPAKTPGKVETAALKPKDSLEKSPAIETGKEKESKPATGKTEEAKAAPIKAEAGAEAKPRPAPAKKEEVAKARAETKPAPLRLQVGEYPDLKSMLKDMNRVKGLGLETAFEEKETEKEKKEYFLVLGKEFPEGEAKAESLKLEVLHKLASRIMPRPEGKAEVWVGPFEKLTEAEKNTKMLKDAGYDTRLETQKKSTKKVYLFVGPFAGKVDMMKAKAVLIKNGFSPEAPVVP